MTGALRVPRSPGFLPALNGSSSRLFHFPGHPPTWVSVRLDDAAQHHPSLLRSHFRADTLLHIPATPATRTGQSTLILDNLSAGSDPEEITVNRAPAFTFTPPVTRSVAENAPAGEPIGDPVSASDADGDTLTYSLWGADGDHFAIDASTGQIRTKGMYDFEQKRGYSVILRVIDGEGGRVSTVVSIAVTGVDE